MAVDRSLIGRSTGTVRVAVERGPVAVFAEAVKDHDPVYSDPRSAKVAGLPGIPAPPTFAFVMEHWGAFPELRPARGDAGRFSAFSTVMGPLLASGGILLHGEQEFIYDRTAARR